MTDQITPISDERLAEIEEICIAAMEPSVEYEGIALSQTEVWRIIKRLRAAEEEKLAKKLSDAERIKLIQAALSSPIAETNVRTSNGEPYTTRAGDYVMDGFDDEDLTQLAPGEGSPTEAAWTVAMRIIESMEAKGYRFVLPPTQEARDG